MNASFRVNKLAGSSIYICARKKGIMLLKNVLAMLTHLMISVQLSALEVLGTITDAASNDFAKLKSFEFGN